MTEPITCEARLMGLSKTRRKDGDWVEIKFHIHPDDHPAALFILPLGTDCNLAISGVAESKDDAPDEPVKLKGGLICKRAVMLCKRVEFQNWLWEGHPPWNWDGKVDGHNFEERMTDILRRLCGIESRAELDHNTEAALIFEQMAHDFYEAQHGETTEAFERMGEEGPG